MAKYRIVGGTPDSNGVLELPDNAKIAGALYHPITGELNIVILQEIPVTGAEEKTPEKVIHLPPVVKTGEEKE